MKREASKRIAGQITAQSGRKTVLQPEFLRLRAVGAMAGGDGPGWFAAAWLRER